MLLNNIKSGYVLPDTDVCNICENLKLNRFGKFVFWAMRFFFPPRISDLVS